MTLFVNLAVLHFLYDKYFMSSVHRLNTWKVYGFRKQPEHCAEYTILNILRDSRDLKSRK